MPIWVAILISLSCSYVGSIVGGIAAFGILFGNKKTFARYLNEEKKELQDKQSSIPDSRQTNGIKIKTRNGGEPTE